MSYRSPNHQAEEKVMLARDEKDHLYEPKPNKKAIRILTVAAYVLCVSLAAIMLSLYYIFFWDPSTKTISVKPTPICPILVPQHQVKTVTESEFRKMTGLVEEGGKVRLISPSIGPSFPTAVINGDRLYAVKEIELEGPKKLPSQFIVANLLLAGGISSSSSSTGSPAEIASTERIMEDMQSDQEADDTEYQEDDEMEFDIEESSGNGPQAVNPEYKTHSVNSSANEEGQAERERERKQQIMMNGNEI